jgi:hypothetical protein
MKTDTGRTKVSLRRRDVLRALGLGAGTAVTASSSLVAQAPSPNQDEKRKARYRADSPEVQTYYRVNRYPK